MAYLVVYNVVARFVNANAVLAGLECFGDILDIDDIGIHNVSGPLMSA